MKDQNFIESLCILYLLYYWSLCNETHCVYLLLLITKPSTTKWVYTDSRALTYSIIRQTMRGYSAAQGDKPCLSCVWSFLLLLFFLARECNHVISSVARLHCGLLGWTTVACLLLFQEQIWVIGKSSRITQNGILISFIQYTKERLFQNNNQQQEQYVLAENVHLLQSPRKLGSCSNLCYRDFSNVTLKTGMHG